MILSRNPINENGLDQCPFEGWEVCSGNELKRRYPELWIEIIKVEKLREEEALKEEYMMQKCGIPREFTHVYCNESGNRIIFAAYWERKVHPLSLKFHMQEMPFKLIRLETRESDLEGHVGKLVFS